MRTVLVIVPGLIGKDDVTPALRDCFEFAQLRDRLRLTRVRNIVSDMPEGQWLGLRHDAVNMPQGPLTVAALGFTPPDRSTHFHVSPVAMVEGQIKSLTTKLAWDDLQTLWPLWEKLNTKTMTLLRGVDRDHGMVWEGQGDLETCSPSKLVGPLADCYPRGDADRLLRRLIDDSVNLLDGIEWNERRREEGLQPVNMIWPWGHGRRAKVPNLLLQRGQPATVLSGSIRLQGLSRLAAYRHPAYYETATGLPTPFEWLSRECLKHDQSVVVLLGPEEFRANDMEEELDWWIHEMARRFLKPLLDSMSDDPSLSVSLIGTNPGSGLALMPGADVHSNLPFDERSLEERSIPLVDLSSLVDQTLSP